MAELIRRVLDREGGVADVGDGKGVTRWGQTDGWLGQFNLPAPTNATEAAENYAAWMAATRLDRLIGPVVDDLADVVIDCAVHSGHAAAIRLLQSALGVTKDGVLGPATLTALAAQERRLIARRVLAARLDLLGGLIATDPGRHARYARGWLRRIGDQVVRLA